MKTLFGCALAIAAAFAADTKPSLTAAEHRTEASRQASRAEAAAAKARKHEGNAERLSKPGYNAMQYKWPAMATGGQTLERERAANARRVEAEAREKLAYHEKMAGQTAAVEP